MLLVRTDLVILNMCVYAWMAFSYRREVSRSGAFYASLLTSILMYFAINSFYSNYGWSILFYHTFVHPLVNPAQAHVAVGMNDYIHALVYGMKLAAKDNTLALGVVPMFLYVYCMLRHRNRMIEADKIAMGVISVSWGYIILHFIVFPLCNIRFFESEYTMMLVVFVYLSARVMVEYIGMKKGISSNTSNA